MFANDRARSLENVKILNVHACGEANTLILRKTYIYICIDKCNKNIVTMDSMVFILQMVCVLVHAVLTTITRNYSFCIIL